MIQFRREILLFSVCAAAFGMFVCAKPASAAPTVVNGVKVCDVEYPYVSDVYYQGVLMPSGREGCTAGAQVDISSSYNMAESDWKDWGWTDSNNLSPLVPVDLVTLSHPYCRLSTALWYTDHFASMAPATSALATGRDKLRDGSYPLVPTCDDASHAIGSWTADEGIVVGGNIAAYAVGGPLTAVAFDIVAAVSANSQNIDVAAGQLQSPVAVAGVLQHERRHLDGTLHTTNNCRLARRLGLEARELDMNAIINIPGDLVRGNLSFNMKCDDSMDAGGAYSVEVKYHEALLADAPQIMLVSCAGLSGESAMCPVGTEDYRTYFALREASSSANILLSDRFKSDPGYRVDDPAFYIQLLSLASVGLVETVAVGSNVSSPIRHATKSDFCWLTMFQGEMKNWSTYVSIGDYLDAASSTLSLSTGSGDGTIGKSLCYGGGNPRVHVALADEFNKDVDVPLYESAANRVCVLSGARGDFNNGHEVTSYIHSDGTWHLRAKTNNDNLLRGQATCTDGTFVQSINLEGGHTVTIENTTADRMFCGISALANDFAGAGEAFELYENDGTWVFSSKNGRSDFDVGGKVYGNAICWRR